MDGQLEPRLLSEEEMAHIKKDVQRLHSAMIAVGIASPDNKEVSEEQMDRDFARSAITSVLMERDRQDVKWGIQNHNPYIYLTILMEEVGELSQAILHTQYGGKAGGPDKVRIEAVHTAAVALAFIECLDRGLWYDEDVCLKHSWEVSGE